jgi:hypothetical protein
MFFAMRVKSTIAGYLSLTAILLLSSLFVMAQITNPSTYDLRFANHQYNCTTDNQFCSEVQIKAATGAGNFAAGSHTIWFYYNKNAINQPVYTSLNFNPQTACTFGTASYNPYSSTAFSSSEIGAQGEANITTLLQSFFPGAECPVVGQEWITMGEVCFTIVNASLPTGLSFDNVSYTIINKSNNTPEHNKGTFTGFNQVPTLDAGAVTASKTMVCRDETIGLSANNYVSGGDNKFVGLAVSNSGTINSYASFSAATKYSLDSTASATKTNNGVYPTNTPLYAYSFIGQYPAYSIDQTCFDISPASTPFVMLKPIVATTSQYVCIGGGQALINILVTGGMPNYQPATQQFSVDVAGATYSGAANINDGETIQLTVSDGAAWEVQFTDSEGCATLVSNTFSAATDCGSCTADAGTPTVDDNFVCWDGTVNWSVNGYTLGAANGYVGMFIAPQNNLTGIPNPATSLTQSAAASKVNDGSGIALNTPYYLYSFIGEGAPFAYNPGCTDISVSSSSFVFLAPITVNTNSQFTYNCTSTSSATIQLTPQGGMPGYNAAETFTVSVTGATYSGAAQVANNTPITVSVSGTNTPWTVTFTDSQGCTGTIGSTFTSSSCAPPACGADSGTASVSDNFICWGGSVNYAATGYSLGTTPPANRYVGLAVSSSNNVTAIDNNFQFVQLYNTPTQTYTHNVSPFVFNTPLYLYSYIGEGTAPGTINTACTDVSAAAGPFVFLEPISTDTAQYACDLATNTANINLVASGGMPAYNAAQKFTVSVSGATYSGATQVSNNQTITINVANNSTWSVTFTDSEGCTGTIGDTFVIGSTDCPGCAANAGTPALSDNYICWNSTVDLSVAGYTLGAADGYVGLALSPDGGIDNLTEFSAATKYSLDAVSTITKTNNNTAFPTNTPIYLYSFIGRGTPFNISNSCHDISAAIGPFVALQNVVINNGGGATYQCNGTTANVSLSVRGGMPAYSGSETFTVTTSAGATYSGGTVANNGTITVSVPQGAWSVTFTDSQGCSATISDVFDMATDCSCNFNIVSATPSPCAPATNTYSLAVNVTYGNVSIGTIQINGQIFVLNGSGNQTFNLTNLTANGATNQAVSATLSATAPSVCTVTRTLSNAYNAPASCAVSCPVPPTANAGADQSVGLNSATLAATVAAPTGATGTWSVVSGNGTFANVNSPTTTVSGLSAGINVFRWTVTLSGCPSASDDVSVNYIVTPACLPINIDKSSSADYCGSGNGAICMNLSGGTAPYTITAGSQTLNNVGNNQQQCLENLSAGNYNITITDANGCTSSAFEAVAIADVLIEYGVSPTNPTCNTSNGVVNADGTICLEFTGGVAPYTVTRNGFTFAIVNTANTEVCINNLATGTYNLVVNDANGCSRSLDVIALIAPSACGNDFSVTQNINQATCQNNGAVCLTVSGGNAPYTVQEGTLVLGTLLEGVSQCLPLSAGTHTLQIIGSDNYSSTTTATIDLPANGCNHLPTVNNDNISMGVNDTAPFCFNPLTNDSDSDGDALTISTATQPNNGTVTISGNQLCYTPVAGFNGTETFTYTACDNDGCNTATITLAVSQAICNNPPLCVGFYPAIVDFCLDFCQLNGGALITEYSTTYNCGLFIHENNCMSYQPLPGFSGNDYIAVTACQSEGDCQTIIIDVLVTANCVAEEPPIANNDSANTSEATSVTISALANDQQTNGDAFVISTFTQPPHGTVVQIGNQFLYTPNAGFDGLDSFSYTICDNDGCDQAFVSITVTNVDCDNPTELCVGLFPNNINFCLDFCELSGAHIIEEYNTTFHCSLDPQGNDCFLYTPLPGFYGDDLISVTACELANPSNCQTIEIPMFVGDCGTPTPQVAPVANNDNASATCTATTINALANDEQTNGDSFTSISVTTQPTHGTLIQNANSFTYTANAGYVGTDSFVYSLCDNDGCDQATVTISVNCPDTQDCINPDNLCLGIFPDNIDFCLDFCDLNGAVFIDTYSTTFNCSIDTLNSPCFTYTPLPGFGMSGSGQQDIISITACEMGNPNNCQTVQINVWVGDCSQDSAPVANNDNANSACTSVTISPLANDQQTDGDVFAIDSHTQTTNGTLTQTGNNFIYTPTPGFEGNDSFTYTICDNDGCSTATVTITVACAAECNNPENLCVGIFPDNIDFCLDFCDLNGSIFIDSYSTTFNCSVDTINSPCFTYTPLPGFGMNGGTNDLITITACQINNPSICQTLYIPIYVGDCDGEQTPPTANNDTFAIGGCTTETLNVMANDQQTQNDPYSITGFTQPNSGTVAQVGNNLTYTPQAGFIGTVSFTYTISDNDGQSTATVKPKCEL